MPTRRDFLTGAASTGLLAALPLERSLGLHGAERAGSGTLAADDTDLSWVARLRGKSRAVFDSPQVSEGGALFRAALWREQMNKAFGTPIEEITPVVVFRHEAIPLVMNDEFWRRMDTGKHIKLRDPNGHKWAKANPIERVVDRRAGGDEGVSTFRLSSRAAASCSPAGSRSVRSSGNT